MGQVGVDDLHLHAVPGVEVGQSKNQWPDQWAGGMTLSELGLCLRIAHETVKVALPANALQIDRVDCFSFKDFSDDGCIRPGLEHDSDVTGLYAIADPIGDQGVSLNLGGGAAEIESFAAVLGFHAACEAASDAEVNGSISW